MPAKESYAAVFRILIGKECPKSLLKSGSSENIDFCEKIHSHVMTMQGRNGNGESLRTLHCLAEM